MSSFRKPYPVIKRLPGEYVNGIWTLPAEPAPTNVLMTIQPAGLSDYEMVVIAAQGRRFKEAFKVYTAALLHCAGQENWPGDIVLYRGLRLLSVGMMDRHTLGTSVSHYRYYVVNEIKEEG